MNGSGRNGSGQAGVGELPTAGGTWEPVRDMAAARAVDDHEGNPEYELHVGRIVETDEGVRRYVSVWLRGRRFHGWLVAGEPDRAEPS